MDRAGSDKKKVVAKLGIELPKLLRALAAAKSPTFIRRHEQELLEAIATSGSPIIRGDEAHFFFDGSSQRTEIKLYAVGDWNGWSRTEQDRFTKVNPLGTLYHLKKQLPIDARLAYRITLDTGGSENDPLNLHAEREVFGTNTVVAMPAHWRDPYLAEPGKHVLRGTVRAMEVPGKNRPGKRDYTRTVHGYLPHGVRNASKLPVLYVHDGTEAMEIGKMVQLLDNLFHSEPHLCRCAVIFVPPVERDREYMLHAGFADWIAHQLVPFVEGKLKLKPTAAMRGTMGASLGGLLSAHLGFLYPNVFGSIIAQSPAFWPQKQRIIKHYREIRLLPLRWYLHTGTIHDALDQTRVMLNVLQEKGYPITYRESNESHNWGNWKGRYSEIVRWFVEG